MDNIIGHILDSNLVVRCKLFYLFYCISKLIGQYHGCYIPYMVKEERMLICCMGVRFYGISDDMKISLIASFFYFNCP